MTQIFRIPILDKIRFIQALDGQIIIGEGADSVILEGNAMPRVDRDGVVVKGEYTLGEYDIFQEGPALIIAKTGIDFGVESAPQLIIKNFPFYSGGFGILLNKEFAGKLSTASEYSDPELFTQTIFAAQDVRGRFFAPAKITSEDGTQNYAIKTFDSRGNNLGSELLTNFNSLRTQENESNRDSITSYYTSNNVMGHRLSNNNTAFIYEAKEETRNIKNEILFQASLSFLTITDCNGLVIYNHLVKESVSEAGQNFIELDPLFIGTGKDGKNYACFSANNENYYCQEFLPSGELSGEIIETKNPEQYLGSVQINDSITLPTQHKIEADTPNGFKIFSPIYVDSSNKNPVKNYYLDNPEEEIPAEKQLMINFCQEIETVARISKNPNSVTIISGLSLSENSRVDLRDFDLSFDTIFDQIFITTPSQYSVQDLLAGKFTTDFDENKNEFKPSEDQGFLNRDANPESTILQLDENQILVFIDFSPENFEENIYDLLILNEEDLEIEQ